MMDAMIAYSAGMMDAVARFLNAEPIIYLSVLSASLS